MSASVYGHMAGLAAALYLSLYIFSFANGVIVTYGSLLNSNLEKFKRKEVPRRFALPSIYTYQIVAVNVLGLYLWHVYIGEARLSVEIPLVTLSVAALYTGYFMGRWSSYGPLRWAILRFVAALRPLFQSAIRSKENTL
jgi:hypothetical protein